MRLSNFVEWVEKNFGNAVSVIDEKFRVDEVIGKVTGYVSATILGQVFEFTLVFRLPRNREFAEGDWFLAGFRRMSDQLHIFRASDIFAAIPKDKKGRPKLFLDFQLVEHNGELVLAVFHDGYLRYAFYIKDMVPQSLGSRDVTRLHCHGNSGELQMPGENYSDKIALKEAVAVSLKCEYEVTELEKRYKQIKRQQVAKAVEAERQRKLAEEEAERLRRNEERQRRREELLARPRISVYRGELAFSALPVTSEEYADGVHLGLPDETGLVVVELNRATGKASGPVKAFIHRKDASGWTKEERTLTEISLERPRHTVEQTVVIVGEIILVDNNGEPTPALVLDDEQYEAMRRRGANHGTLFVRKGKREKDGRWSVFRFSDRTVDTVGLMVEV